MQVFLEMQNLNIPQNNLFIKSSAGILMKTFLERSVGRHTVGRRNGKKSIACLTYGGPGLRAFVMGGACLLAMTQNDPLQGVTENLVASVWFFI